ncbi:MAG TPA: hypothetical protein VFM93_00010 [Candidatus Limnocylindria bacterium]|nr:hypothetical protein [Candidatus Limnocylindria bacterium]
MGEDASARTQADIAALRRGIEGDLDALAAKAKADLDIAALARRQPVAVFGTLGSLVALGGAAIAARVRASRQRRPDTEIERIVEELGGRIDRLKGRARKRFREQLRREISEVEKPKRTASEALWSTGMAAFTAFATELARKFGGRLAADEHAPAEGREL